MGGMILKIAWALLAAISGLTATYAQSMPEDECATGVHAIIARGQGGGDDLNVMSTLSDLILKQIPGSTTLGLPYDHENVLTDFAKLHTVHDGAVLMQQFVQEYSESCPQAKIVVVGYSMVRHYQTNM
ncbi:Acetylxylan esterase, putative [Penicillium digitatum PHI26]|uniref:Acetylxylan esterase, putative n=2 Tax=Penicillium digitatum TaxID=36651 RepID=K9GAR0_PEND2|nr:Acetylxylan esterase, putative [Penicillium digitatum Pd1]EKV05523.1 Acetylxylan esterase, putative [Penicillium digitatum Pd1]EKV18179.1 Acetylxylan esterase, putative [Penicillium digitatum PHI26]